MLISCPIEAIDNRLGDRGAIEAIAKAGFGAYDMSLFRMKREPDCGWNTADYRTYAKELRRFADSLGIVCNQSHAPYPTSYGDERDAPIFDRTVRAIECAALLGAKSVVVHPLHHLDYEVAENRERMREMNLTFYEKLLPYARGYGIAIAVENMWQRTDGRCSHSTCSMPAEFCDYVDAHDDPYLVGCLDLGHVNLMPDSDLPAFIHALGAKRLRALHVHDNDGIRDAHTIPYLGCADIDGAMRALGQIGYEGDLTFECHGFLRPVPEELLPDALLMLRRVGEHLVSIIEQEKMK